MAREGAAVSDEPYCYVTWVGGLRVIVLDSTVPGAAHGELDKPQLDWLRAELEPAAEGTHTIRLVASLAVCCVSRLDQGSAGGCIVA